MVTIKLYGDLRRFGTQYDFNVETAQEALSGLFSQLLDLKRVVQAGFYYVKFNGKQITTDELKAYVFSKGDVVIHITPAVEGAGKWGQAIVGAVLVVVGTYSGQAWMVSIGAGMMFGGIASALTKPPQLGESGNGVESSTSNPVGNLDNMTAQNAIVPIAYGEIMTGSLVASIGVESLRNDPKAVPEDPSGKVVMLDRTPIKGIPAISPDGRPYRSDAANDSVLAQLYVVKEG